MPLSSANIIDFLGMEKSSAGINVTEAKALGMSAVWRSVTLISGVAASLPFGVFEADGDARVPSTGWAADLLKNPHPDMTPFELWETVYTHMLLWGNAYLRVLRDGMGKPVELWPIHPGRVKVGRTSEMGKKIYAIDGGKEQHDDTTILHIPGFGYDGICGVSPIRAARQSIGLALAAEEYGAKLFGSGSLATGILQTEQRLTSEQADTLHARWKAKRSGLGTAHETMILDNGAKFQQLSIPPEDAQFLESRRFQINETSRWYGVPAFLMFETEKSTSWGTGLEQQALGWVVYDLRRWLIRVEQRVTRLANSYKPGRLNASDKYARYNVDGLLRGDSAARAAFYKSMWDIGVLNTNEIRALEEKAPVDGGEVRYRPLNMGVLGEDDTEPPAPEAPNPAAEAASVAAMVQQMSPGVDRMLTPAEARSLLKQAGAELDGAFEADPSRPRASVLNADGVTVNVEPADVQVTINVEPADVTVQPAEVTVVPGEAPVVNVDSPVTVNVEPTPVTVDAPVHIAVAPAGVTVIPAEPKTRRIERDRKGDIVAVHEEP